MSTIVLGVIPIGILLLLVVDWIRVSGLYGGSRLAAVRLMLFTVWASQSRWLLFTAAVSVAGTTYLASDSLFRETVPIAAVVSLLAIPVLALMVRLRPPAILFLGSSRSGQELFQELRLRANRYRVIAFLAQPGDLLGAQALAMDGFRTRTTDWAHVVRGVAQAVPLLVVDTRDPTPHVVEELRWLVAPSRRERVIFISADNGALPALERLDRTLSTAGLNVTRARDCVDAVRRRLQSVAQSPTPLPLEPYQSPQPSSDSIADEPISRCTITVAGFLHAVMTRERGWPARLIAEEATSYGLVGYVFTDGPDSDLIVAADGPASVLARLPGVIESFCPGSVRFMRGLGFAGGIQVVMQPPSGGLVAPRSSLRIGPDPYAATQV